MDAPSVKDYEDTILRYSRVCFKKLKRPTYLSLEDIVQEANTVFAICLNKYDRQKHKVFYTFFITCLKNRFGTIVCNSYKTKVDKYSEEVFESQSDISSTDEPVEISESIFSRINKNVLQQIDLEFIKMLIEPPANIVEDIVKFPKKAHKIVADALHMSSVQRRQSEQRIVLAIVS